VNKDSSGEMGYKELLELCGQDVGDDDHEMEYDDNYHHVDDSDDSDDDTYYSGTTKIKVRFVDFVTRKPSLKLDTLI
jgi:hypothetical protein